MIMKQTQPQNWLFRLAVSLGKYTLLFIFGRTLASLISLSLGISDVAGLFVSLLSLILWRILMIIICVLAMGIVIESMR
jgi:hypothetical protein